MHIKAHTLDTQQVTVTGVGGHAAAGIGHAVTDPVIATTTMITNLHVRQLRVCVLCVCVCLHY